MHLGNDYLGQEFYEIKKIGLTAATFSVSIQIFGVTNLWLLTVAYIAVDPTFPHHLNSFDNVPINATGGDIVPFDSHRSILAQEVRLWHTMLNISTTLGRLQVGGLQNSRHLFPLIKLFFLWQVYGSKGLLVLLWSFMFTLTFWMKVFILGMLLLSEIQW